MYVLEICKYEIYILKTESGHGDTNNHPDCHFRNYTKLRQTKFKLIICKHL